MKSLFNEDETWTDEAVDISIHINQKIREIFNMYSEDHNIRELQYIIENAAQEISLGLLMDKRMK
jgi:hypothetical protein